VIPILYGLQGSNQSLSAIAESDNSDSGRPADIPLRQESDPEQSHQGGQAAAATAADSPAAVHAAAAAATASADSPRLHHSCCLRNDEQPFDMFGIII
jgi:hypothetical protein